MQCRSGASGKRAELDIERYSSSAAALMRRGNIGNAGRIVSPATIAYFSSVAGLLTFTVSMRRISRCSWT